MIASEPKPGKIGESQHWYTRDGKPAHDQPNKSKPGETRPTTLRDARTQLLLPSVSSILGVMAKKGLEGWIKTQVAEAAVAEALDKGICNDQEFVAAVLERAESQMTKARDLGTEIHGAIERYLDFISDEFEDTDKIQLAHWAHIKAAKNALKELGVWGQPFSSERTFASPLGYGGTIDFKSGGLICDFKGVDSLVKKLDYPDRVAQLCAYCAGGYAPWRSDFMNPEDMVSNFRLVNIFISTSNPGEYLIHEWSQEDKEHGWSLFKACLNLWKVANRYDPAKQSDFPAPVPS